MARTSNHAVKLLVTWAMIFALISVIGVCPVVAGGMSAGHSCCPHSTEKQIPCTESTARNCPYVLLEKAKAEQWVAVAALVAVAAGIIARIHPNRFSSLIHPRYNADFSTSYPPLQVLRI
jgi:hypothetical protein